MVLLFKGTSSGRRFYYMDWLGIGVLVIGVALLGLVFVLIKPLNKLAGVFNGLQKTVDQLPEQVGDVMTQAKDTLETGNSTLHQVNDQVKQLSPLFYIVGDAGRATQHVSSTMVDRVMSVKEGTSEGNDFIQRNHLEGWYGLATLGYFIYQKRKSLSNNRININ